MMKKVLSIIKLGLASIILAIGLNGCGGGGGSSDTSTSIDTIAPMEPTLIVPPTSATTSEKSVTITVRGEVGTRVYVNDIKTDYTIDDDGFCNIILDTSSEESGEILFSITIRDVSGNVSDISTVTIIKVPISIDTSKPVITIKGSNSVTVIQNAIYTDAGATATDNVDDIVTVIATDSVDTSTVGVYTITYTATDKAGNKATAKRIINVVKETIIDTISPVITIKGSNPITVIQNVIYTDAGATAIDNIDGTVTVISTGSVDTSILGIYTITYTSTDKAGNKATTTRKVNVTLPPDTVAPVITVTGANPLTISQGETFSDLGATAIDNKDGTVSVTPNGTVDMSTIGDYTITYTATDEAGNESTATRTVTVKSADVVWEVSSVTEFRQALEDAAANGENDRIILAKGIYNVTSDKLGTLTFNDNEAFNLTIEAEKGLTSKDIILDGNNSKQIFNFSNTQSSILILKNISVINSQLNGGQQAVGVYSSHDIEIYNSKFSFHSNGFKARTAKVINSTVSYNTSNGFIATTVVVSDSNISNNDGIGFNSYFTTVKNSILSHNRYGFSSVYSSIVTNSILSYNKDGGILQNNGNLTITNSNISYNGIKGVSFDGKIFIMTNSILINNYIACHLPGNSSYLSNNIFKDNKSSLITAGGIFINNIFATNTADITLRYDSKIYNNYIDYSKIEDGGNNVIKKNNLQYASIGDIYLSDDNVTLTADSPVIDKGLNPSSVTFKELINNDEVYNTMVELLKTDKIANRRVHNGTIDMGAVEYGSSK